MLDGFCTYIEFISNYGQQESTEQEERNANCGDTLKYHSGITTTLNMRRRKHLRIRTTVFNAILEQFRRNILVKREETEVVHPAHAGSRTRQPIERCIKSTTIFKTTVLNGIRSTFA
jgi:hypothetical protein